MCFAKKDRFHGEFDENGFDVVDVGAFFYINLVKLRIKLKFTLK